MSSHGTKVTSTAPTHESTGLVTSDSLAADSLSSGGSFAASNPHAAASQQPSSSTTSNATDTSSATTLPPAVDAEAREAKEGWVEEGRLNAGRGLGESGKEGGDGSATTGGYAGASHAARPPGDFRPHGANTTEDEQLSGRTAFGAVGTKMDPSRVAEEERLKRAAVQGGSLGGAKDGSVQGGSKFSGLGEEGA